MFRKFLKDIRGHYLVLTAISTAPVTGGLAIADELSNLRMVG